MEHAQKQMLMGDEHGNKLTNSFTRQPNINNSNNNNGSGNNNSSTRWTPTTDQIRILKDLYYNNGVRSPTAEQIQRISARLRQYGKIEGKNVFYWFQNHKARERQKKRFNSANSNLIINTNATGLVPVAAAAAWKPSDYTSSSAPNIHSPAASKYIYPTGHNQMSGFGYGSITMEKSFRDCSISAGGSSMAHNFGWAGTADHHLPHHSYPSYASSYAVYEHQQRKSGTNNNKDYQSYGFLVSAADQDYYGENRAGEIETLPLFPMHGEDINYSFCHFNPAESDGWFHRDIGGSRASLELSLNSYAGMDRI